MKQFIISLGEEAGKTAIENLGKLKIHSKGVKNVFTDIDVEIEKNIIQKIKEKFPSHNIVSEETKTQNSELADSEYTWYIDPIDGTANYVHGDPNFCVSIALAKHEEIINACVHIPMLYETYYAEKGLGAELNSKKISVSKTKELKNSMIQLGISPLKDTIDNSLSLMKHFMLNADRARDHGACSLQLAYVSGGRAEGFVKYSQRSWDIAAGILLVQEAGGKATDMLGNKIALDKNRSKRYNLIASNTYIHDAILSEIEKLSQKLDLKNNKQWY